MTINYSMLDCNTGNTGCADIFCEIEKLKSYILQNNCKTMSIDISSLNFIDAAKVCILCSTFHFAKYIDGKIHWFVKDEIIKDQIKPMGLGNVEIEIKRNVSFVQNLSFKSKFLRHPEPMRRI